MPLRWGIASAGKISHDFVCALTTLSEKDHKVVAVAARSLDSAQKFADLHGISQAYEGYAALAKNPNIGKNLGCLRFLGVTNFSRRRCRIHWSCKYNSSGNRFIDAGTWKTYPMRETTLHE